MTSTFILVDIKAGLRSNSELLEVNLTRRAAKIKVLDGDAYPEFRFISNAIKYNTPNGDVRISVIVAGDGQIKVGVSDTGKGIAKEDIPKIFEAFNRLGAEKTEVEGTGMGLPITKNIIELMGGTLDVESVKDQGSTFWVSLMGSRIE